MINNTLGDNLLNRVTKVNWPNVLGCKGIRDFGDEGYKGGVNVVGDNPFNEHPPHKLYSVLAYNMPTFLVKHSMEAIKARGFKRGQVKHYLPNLRVKR